MEQLPNRLCSKPFGESELSIVRNEIGKPDPLLRAEIARRVCNALQWVDITGKPKLMSARKALESSTSILSEAPSKLGLSMHLNREM